MEKIRQNESAFSGPLVLDVTSSCKSPVHTGVQRMVRGMYRQLSSASHVVPVIWRPALNGYCGLSPRQHRYLTKPFEESGESGSDFPHRSGKALGWVDTIWNYLFMRRCRHAVLLVPEIFQDGRMEFLADAQSLGTKKVAVFHDALNWRHPEWVSAHRLEGFEKYMERLAGFHLVVCVSRQSCDDLHAFWKEKGLRPAPTVVEPWPIDFSQRPETSQPEGARILTVGTLEHRKNHLTLIKACRSLWEQGERFTLVIVGRQIESCPEPVREIEKAIGEGLPVEWLRHVDDETLRSEYERCRFTVYPSLGEGYGLPIIESLWYGRPCVCSGEGAIGEVACGGGCAAVEPQSFESVAAAIRGLLDRSGEYERLRQEALDREFRTWEDYGKRMLAYFDKLW